VEVVVMLLEPIIIVTMFKTVAKIEFLFKRQKLCVEKICKKQKKISFLLCPLFDRGALMN